MEGESRAVSCMSIERAAEAKRIGIWIRVSTEDQAKGESRGKAYR